MFTSSNIIAASALAVIVGLFSRCPFLRRRPAAMHLLWLIVLAKFVTPAFIPAPVFPAEVMKPLVAQIRPQLPPVVGVPGEGALTPGDPISKTARLVSNSIRWTTILPVVSLSGSFLILLYAILKMVRFCRLLESATRDPRLSQLLETCRQRMSVARVPDVLCIDARCSPFLLALPGRPCIYVPRVMLNDLSDAALEPILGHELAHHLRRDASANLFAFIVAALLWWNPLVWWSRRELRRAQELCCDALVIDRHSVSRRDYAEILLSTLDRLSGAYQAPACLAAGWGDLSSLKERFRMIGDRNVVPRISRAWSVLMLFLAMALLCVPGHAQPKPGQPDAKDAPNNQTWKAQIVDGETGKPFGGAHVLAGKALLTADDNGMVEISVTRDSTAVVSVTSTGWWSSGGNIVGNAKAMNIMPRDPNQPLQIKAWHGTTVSGRLLDPDTRPVANATLVVGTYITSQEWKKRLDMDLSFNSWDHGDWPNWSYSFETDADGKFEIAIPPDDARSWIRIGTMDMGANYAIGQDPNGPAKALVKYAPFEQQIEAVSNNGKVEFGDIQLTRGTALRGKVVDAVGKGLSGIMLYTSGKHGPYYGRSAVSDKDGNYQFLPMHPGGPFTLSPYAQLHGEDGIANSRDVQAVFVPQEINLPQSDKPVEMIIRAVPHVTLEFEWVDRRAKKGPVAYYGTFDVHGQVKREDGTMVSWRGETEMMTRDGKQIAFVKVPRALKNPIITLPADSVVTASYSDGEQKSGPGNIEVRDIAQPGHRVIYGDEPRPRKP